MTSETDWNGLKHQSNLHWMMMSSKMIWLATWKATFRCENNMTMLEGRVNQIGI